MDESTFLAKTLVITAVISLIIILALRKAIKKPVYQALQPGCLISIIVMIIFITFCCVKCSVYEPLYNSTSMVKIIDESERVTSQRISNDLLTGNDSTYRNSRYLYQNKTGRILVEYSVKYTKDGTGESHSYGKVIYPDEFFLWFGEGNDSYRLFGIPPSHTTVYTSRKYELNFTYLTFLNYIDCIPDYVELIGLKEDGRQ